MKLDLNTTALILIDLQKGIVSNDLEPRSGQDVVANARKLADHFRESGGTVVNVHVNWSPSGEDMPSRNSDEQWLPDETPGKDFSQFEEGIFKEGDIEILKHHWGAFVGTELDLQLRRRDIKTVVIGGIATNMGVESTVRSAYEFGYDVVIAEDLCATRSKALQDVALEQVLPKLARIVSSSQLELSNG
mgnify:FL=1